MRSVLILLLFLHFPFSILHSQFTQSLNSNWQFSESGKNEWKTATVPGTVHTDLLANKLIPDPDLDANEKAVQWVETKTWEYRTTFDCSKFLWKQKHKELDFEGLDTYADVYLNDSLLFTAEDMFLSYTKDVTKLLKKKKNVLRVVFHPIAELIAKNKNLDAVKDLPGGDRVYVRKAQYQFGWDWGPRLVTCGIWKNVKLVGYTRTFIRDAHFNTIWISGDSAYVKYSVTLGGASKSPFSLEISVNDTMVSLDPITIDQRAAQPVIEGHFVIQHPKLWWCNGLGDPYLYTINVALKAKKWTQSKDFSFGVRTIELQQQNPADGKPDFRFILNGKDVFVKGTNWIPCDNFIPRVTHQKYSGLLAEAKNENMNMLRVWGGGIYEQDDFYNLCDSLGIMVWQDFMFACGMYPGSLSFYNEVQDEAYDNLLRLANHPCISVWCGNNEDDEGWQNWDWKKDVKEKDQQQIETDYRNVFNNADGILVRAVREVNSKWFPYIATSPLTGWGHDEAYKQGDVHYWGVWWGEEPISSYDTHIGRFVSEYGFQSFPSESSANEFITDRSNFYHTLLFDHQKDPNGMKKLDDYFKQNFSSENLGTDEYGYLTQVMQRDALTHAIEAHRRNEPYCMGTLYWQYDDCWPAISWSTTDFYGQKKLAQYAIKDLYAPELISITEQHDSVVVYAVNDEDGEKQGRIGYVLQQMDSTILEKGENIYVDLPPHSSSIVLVLNKKKLLSGRDSSAVFFGVFSNIEGSYYPYAIHYFVSDKELKLRKDPGISFYIPDDRNLDSTITVYVNTVFLAKNVYVMLDDRSAELDDNGFDMIPLSEHEIKIRSVYGPAELRKKLSVYTVNQFK